MIKRKDKVAAHGSAMLGLLFVCVLSFTADMVFSPSKPVMSWVMPTGQWEFGDGYARNVFSGFKVRECPIIPHSQKGQAIINGELVTFNVSVEWFDDDTPESTFPPGVIAIGTIQWTLPNLDHAQKLGMILSHQCALRVVESHYWYELPLADRRERIDEPPRTQGEP